MRPGPHHPFSITKVETNWVMSIAFELTSFVPSRLSTIIHLPESSQVTLYIWKPNHTLPVLNSISDVTYHISYPMDDESYITLGLYWFLFSSLVLGSQPELFAIFLTYENHRCPRICAFHNPFSCDILSSVFAQVCHFYTIPVTSSHGASQILPRGFHFPYWLLMALP